jgi:hypothetical protein
MATAYVRQRPTGDTALLQKLFRKADFRRGERPRTAHLAFVLLPAPDCPTPEAVVACYKQFEPQGTLESTTSRNAHQSGGVEALSFEFGSDEPIFVALIPAAVPKGEADEGVQFSVSALGTGWILPDHSAHLVVTAPGASSLSPLAELSRFTSFLAAVVKSSQAVGVYWGNAGATHDPGFFTEVASEPGVVPRIMLWTGLSVARDQDGRLSLLSLGMRQLQLPDLMLVVSKSAEDSAIEFFFDLLSYSASRGEPIPAGETVGRTADERFPVRYVPSPINKGTEVWRVEVS